ncbi:CRISPR system precrRNA processing endoribonuclease RAMP protein Cas6 [Candidatus Poribacteria bacterium]|nr:CRISPR system precrRNA processing endoribonuclease RAMP protein Cas6 [Candidatus Poribacteria bacterium]
MIPEEFRFAQYRFTLRALTTIQLPRYKGSALRGAFGRVFKRMVCLQPLNHPRDCDVCSLRSECPYGTVFENALPSDVEPLPGYAGIPHPFIFEPPLDRRRAYLNGDTFAFDLILIGRAISMMPYFLSSFLELGKIGLGRQRGKYVLESVYGIHPTTSEAELIYTEGGHVRDWDGGVTYSELIPIIKELTQKVTNNGNRIRIEFITPTRLISDGKPTDSISFSILMRSLLRRISSLCYFHCGETWETDFAQLTRQAEAIANQPISLHWDDWKRYSSRQKERIPMGGMLGCVEYYGDIEIFLPCLLLGTWLHVGKATTFGNGKYLLKVPESDSGAV